MFIMVYGRYSLVKRHVEHYLVVKENIEYFAAKRKLLGWG